MDRRTERGGFWGHGEARLLLPHDVDKIVHRGGMGGQKCPAVRKNVQVWTLLSRVRHGVARAVWKAYGASCDAVWVAIECDGIAWVRGCEDNQ